VVQEFPPARTVRAFFSFLPPSSSSQKKIQTKILKYSRVFQLPVFFIGARGLYKGFYYHLLSQWDYSHSFKKILTPNPSPHSGSRTIYPLLALYASSTATTTLACVFQVLQTPETTPETLAQNLPSITPDQRLMLLSSYIPFFLIPFIMAVDMGIRSYKLVKIAIKKEEKQD
jgi:EXPERA (EXPanded EBP superfamily)